MSIKKGWHYSDTKRVTFSLNECHEISGHVPVLFSKRRYYRKPETYPLQQRKNKQAKQKQQHEKTKPKKKLHINKIPFDLESTFLYLIYFLFRIPWVPLWIGFNMESFNLRIAYIFFKFIFNIFNFLISRVKWLSHFT